MSHRHFCNFAGHEWECEGTALRLLAGDTNPSVCTCLTHGVPMEDGDHSACSIELLACAEHFDEYMLAMGYAPGSPVPSPSRDDQPSTMFQDEDSNRIVGFCLWCNKDFYTVEESEAHETDEMAACEVFQELKDEDCGSPVLHQIFEQAGLMKMGRTNEPKETT